MERVTEYFSQLLEVIRESHWIVNEDLTLREIDLTEGYVRGILYLYGGFTLHVAEYIEIKKGLPNRSKYRFQLQDHNGVLVRRWDNAPHHNQISTYPNHCHTADDRVNPSSAVDIPIILSYLADILEAF